MKAAAILLIAVAMVPLLFARDFAVFCVRDVPRLLRGEKIE
jgi:hypothetical protein